MPPLAAHGEHGSSVCKHAMLVRVPSQLCAGGHLPDIKVSGPSGWKAKSETRHEPGQNTPDEEAFVVTFFPRLPGVHTARIVINGKTLPPVSLEVPASAFDALQQQQPQHKQEARRKPLSRTVSDNPLRKHHDDEGDVDDDSVHEPEAETFGFSSDEEADQLGDLGGDKHRNHEPTRTRANDLSRHRSGSRHMPKGHARLSKQNSMPLGLMMQTSSDSANRCSVCLKMLKEGGRSYTLLGRVYCKTDFKQYYYKGKVDESPWAQDLPKVRLSGLRSNDLKHAQQVMKSVTSWDPKRFCIADVDGLALLRVFVKAKYGSVSPAMQEETRRVFQNQQFRSVNAVFEDELLGMFAEVVNLAHQQDPADADAHHRSKRFTDSLPRLRTSKRDSKRPHSTFVRPVEEQDAELQAKFSGDRRSDAWMLY